MCGWMVSVDDVLQRHGTPSQTGPTSTPEAIQDQQSSGGSLREDQCTGAGTGSTPEVLFRSTLRSRQGWYFELLDIAGINFAHNQE